MILTFVLSACLCIAIVAAFHLYVDRNSWRETAYSTPSENEIVAKYKNQLESEMEQRMALATRALSERNEIERSSIEDTVQKAATVKFETWKVKEEKKIREDAIKRSNSVVSGKVTEHLIPHLPDFNFNPRDCRFLGSPIDFIIFDGLDGEDLKEVVFIEIKTGDSARLTDRERAVKRAIEEKRVKWITIHKKQ